MGLLGLHAPEALTAHALPEGQYLSPQGTLGAGPLLWETVLGGCLEMWSLCYFLPVQLSKS